MKYFKKFLIFLVLLIPCFIYGKAYTYVKSFNDAKSYVQSLYSGEDYNNHPFIIKDSSSLLSFDEFKRTMRKSNIISSSYLYEGTDFFVDGNSNRTILGSNVGYVRNTIKVKNTDVVPSSTGSFSNPWVFDTNVDKYTVTYNLNGGFLDGDISTKTINISVNVGSEYKVGYKKGSSTNKIIPERTDFDFLGWYDTTGKLHNIGEVISDSITLKAEWSQNLCKTNAHIADKVDTESNTTIKVLNIYPTRKLLDSWFKDSKENNVKIFNSEVIDSNTTKFSKNDGSGFNIQVTSVKIDDFNSKPNNYLKNNGVWNYDVLIFGFADCNGKKDLSHDASYAVEDYINSSMPVIMGHDTFSVSSNTYCGSFSNGFTKEERAGNEGHVGFNRLGKYFYLDTSKQDKASSERPKTVIIPKDKLDSECSVIYNKPNDILSNAPTNGIYDIPETHITTGIPLGDDDNFIKWLYYTNSESLPYIYTYNHYIGEDPLTHKDITYNTAYISAGHKEDMNGHDSNSALSKTTITEVRILVNLIYYMDYMSKTSRGIN